jgi:hypothetical protein
MSKKELQFPVPVKSVSCEAPVEAQVEEKEVEEKKDIIRVRHVLRFSYYSVVDSEENPDVRSMVATDEMAQDILNQAYALKGSSFRADREYENVDLYFKFPNKEKAEQAKKKLEKELHKVFPNTYDEPGFEFELFSMTVHFGADYKDEEDT